MTRTIEIIPMIKTMFIFLGLAFLALGILGITGVVPMIIGIRKINRRRYCDENAK